MKGNTSGGFTELSMGLWSNRELQFCSKQFQLHPTSLFHLNWLHYNVEKRKFIKGSCKENPKCTKETWLKHDTKQLFKYSGSQESPT